MLLEKPLFAEPAGAFPEMGLNHQDWVHKTFLFLEACGFHPESEKLLIAVSGGIDSMVLLHFWRHYAGPRFQNCIEAAHVDHGLRRTSGRDRVFVEEICRTWGIPLHTVTLDPGSRLPRESVEMWGRRMRYKYFESICGKRNIDRVLTAHHLDDQVETVFMHLLRSAEVWGLRGIHFRRKPNIIRPFLNRRRGELERYAAGHGLKWMEDESNKDLRFLRNRFRLQIIPQWVAKNGDPADSILKITTAMQAIWPAIEKHRNITLGAVSGSSGISLSAVQKYGKREPDMVRNLLNASAKKEGIVLKKPFFREFLVQLQRSPGNINVQADSTHYLRVSHGCLEFRELEAGKSAGPGDLPLNIDLSGRGGSIQFKWDGRFSELKFRRFVKPPGYVLDKNGGWHAFLDGKTVLSTLTLRKRMNGDKFAPLGVPSRKRKLKMYFNSIGLSVDERDDRMLFCMENTVVWIPGIQISDFFKVTNRTREILHLEIQCPK